MNILFVNPNYTFALCVLFFLVSCSPPHVDSSPEKAVSKLDIIGIWKLNYNGKVVSDNPSGFGFGVETLIFKEDFLYEQIFNDLKGSVVITNKSSWKFQTNSHGQVTVCLKDMRLFPHGVHSALHNIPPKQTQLLVQTSSNLPFGKKYDLILCFEEADLNMCFERSKTNSATNAIENVHY